MKKKASNQISEKILLLTDLPPCKNYSGGLMSSQLVKMLLDEKQEVFCYSIMSEYLEPIYNTDINNDINMEIVDRPEENLSNATKQEIKKYYNRIKKIEKELINYIKINNITKIWCPIQGEVLTRIMANIYRKTKIPYVVQIWDPIEWWIKEHNFDKIRANETLEIYRNVIKNATKCITTSRFMSNKYKKELSIKCVTVMPPINIKINKIPVKREDSAIIIAMCGQVYARQELDKLLMALDEMNWQYNGKKIFFYHYGIWNETYINSEKHKKWEDRIVKKGFLPQDELFNELIKCDLLYCPYFFTKDKIERKVSELSFPSKLVTYLAINVPILIHAPEYSAPYKFLKENNGAYFINTLKVNRIKDLLSEILQFKEKETIVENARLAFSENFTEEKVKQNFLEALDIPYDGKKKLNILEVNNLDLPGRRFNGYDLQNEINQNTIHRAKQIVTYKESDNKNVLLFHESNERLWAEWRLIDAEANELAVHSQLSLTSNILKNNDSFINADVVHYHLTHNTKLSLYQMIELCSNKPSVWTFHDPWPFTGRCVSPQECEKWMSGCKNCNHLTNLFPLKADNCKYLWNLKKNIYPKLDIDIVVTTPFMENMIKNSPLTQCFKNVHLIPFGIDLNKFNDKMGREKARKILKIQNDDIVLFFRAQMAMKGTEYIIEALKKLNCEKKITLLTCSETGLLEELKRKYNIIELGNIDDDKVITAYNACDIFLMPSRSESFGLMAIEAMACSRPIIIFNNSALPSVTFAPECGVLVENKNSDKLMEAIKYMIESPEERKRRGTLGRALAEEHYDINKYHEKIFKLYETVYERQKEKKTIIENEPIDYSLDDVQILIRKLEIIYNKVFPGEKLEADFLKHKLEGKINLKKAIDYSNESVQLILKMFNECVYERWNKYKVNQYEESPGKIEVLLDLYKNDRHELLHKISKKFTFNKIVYLIVRTGYRFFREIKHIICRDKYKRQMQRIDTLERKILDLQYRMEIQEKRVQKIEENKSEIKKSEGNHSNTSI